MWKKFLERTKTIYGLRSSLGLLAWDQETMMPASAGEHRAEVMSAIDATIHKEMTDSDFLRMMEETLSADTLTAKQQDCVRLVLKDAKRLLKIPADLQREMTRTCSLAQQAWEKARTMGTPDVYLPWLKKLVELKREEAKCLSNTFDPRSPMQGYNTLLDQYEPGMTTQALDQLFDNLIPPLREVMADIEAKADKFPNAPQVNISTERQHTYMLDLLKRIGFSLNHGRLDVSVHPFTEGVTSQDVRLTSRYDETNISDALFSTLHEGGHGMYEQGLSTEFSFTPLAESVSLGIHESQSRYWENLIGRSRSFWEGEWENFVKVFPELSDYGLENWLLHINRVQPSLIRVDADELTYNLHVYIRYSLEKKLFEGTLEVEGLEAAWNKMYQEELGIEVPDVNRGFMQDVHWSAGLFGYFPTYTLGNLYSAQIASKIEATIDDFPEKVKAGDFSEIHSWLSTNIFSHGRRHEPAPLILRSCGADPDSKFFLNYLKNKYQALLG